MISSWIAYVIWAPIGLFLFWRYPVRVAILVNFLAGWGLLPAAAYAPTNAAFPYWILGICLPSLHFLTKATVTGLICLMGILLFDRKVLARWQFSFWDLPIIIWCIVPLLSAIANQQSISDAAFSVIYQILAWGIPYLAGRLYFADRFSRELAAKAFVIAGLAYVPICLIEILTGPQLYAHLYGYQPYRWIGAQRYFGYRPIGFLEDGNQLGIWMATSALLAVWLWRRRLVAEIVRLPIAWVSAILLATTLLCQSMGSIVLLVCLLPFVFVRRSYLPRAIATLLLLAILGSISLRLANIVSLRSAVQHNRVAQSAAGFLKSIDRGSFGWRLSQDEKHVSLALETTALGTGRWDWWGATESRPWGLWLLVFGMYGIIGLLALQCLQLFPVARILRAFPAESERFANDLFWALASVILMSAIDNLLNGSMILPLLLIIGGLSAPDLIAPDMVSSTSKAYAGRTGSRSPAPERPTVQTLCSIAGTATT